MYRFGSRYKLFSLQGIPNLMSQVGLSKAHFVSIVFFFRNLETGIMAFRNCLITKIPTFSYYHKDPF